jgi:phosphatidylethanolamine-binding protein (PEBP) family uncharacterized protein
VAQRTAAERFLRSSAKAAGAGVSLALAVAALALPGCGGSSSADPASSSGSTDAAQGKSASAAGPAAEKSNASGPGGDAAGRANGEQGPGQTGEGGAAAAPRAHGHGKHGPHIVPPKGPPEQAPTPAEIANATVADIGLQSPAILASGGQLGRLASQYTCDGKDVWPAFSWSGVPAGSTELILYVMSLQPVEEKLFVDWAVAGLDPGLTGIDSGQLPKGAIVGTNGFGKRGYEICPAGAGETYMFALYALPRSLSPPKGFDAREMRQDILDVSGDVGLLPAVYERG